jgi:NUMOD3 motif
VIAAPVAAEWKYLLAIPARPPASPEHKANISAALKGKPKSAAHRANLWANRQVTPEFEQRTARNGTAHKGRPKSAETRAKMSATQAAGRPVLTDAIVQEIKQLLADGGSARPRSASSSLTARFTLSTPVTSHGSRRRKSTAGWSPSGSAAGTGAS